MKINMRYIRFFIAGWISLGCALAYAYDDGDFQIWNTDSQEFTVNEKLKITEEEEFRWQDDASDFYYQHYDTGLTYSLNKHFSFGGGYRHVLEEKKIGKSIKFRTENEPYATATFFWALKDFKFEDRSRMEYRHFDYTADSFRYRNKLTVKFPWAFTALKIQPYISDEILVGFGTTNQLNQNRLSGGFGMTFTKNFKGEAYYMFLSSKSKGKWVDANVLGLKFKAAF